ncbi:PH domain-containing protein [Corynebacterium sp. B5-R-101]|uniref:PH domain-containing protein n=1 Tax=Corynebacterium intestinale TaxID=2943492 RepID=A0ABT0TBF9_9CORY|nr:PH domain-containing protein [Corynebacterium intestinale]MCL8494425.1 PH domain-containing protein [Corynebacterium intestinale]MCP1390661.1 PH domain-containing protein [Corynebacterium intestinale]
MNPVSPSLTKARYITNLSWDIILAALAAVAAYFWWDWLYWVAGAFLVWALYELWLIPAQVKNLGWQETADELLVTRGKIWHTFTVVPYGRIQFVDVTAGPVERAMGLKKVKLHTASPSSDATIPGLLAADADALRERLAVKARERMSGL